MEKVLSNELSRFLLILGIGAISFSALLAKKVSSIRESFAPYQKPTMWYLLLSLLFFALAATAEWLLPKGVKTLTTFLLLQMYFLLLGVLHLLLMHYFLKWSGQEKSFWIDLLFSLIVAMFGTMVFVVIYRQFNNEGIGILMASGVWLFIIPLLFYEMFVRAISIPLKVVKHWYYPVNEKVEEPDENKLKNLLIISFEFQKKATDRVITNFRAKAPTDMEFGQLFYFFINDYAERHPNSKIDIVTNSGEAYGWIFYKRPRWYTLRTRYIDFDNSIYLNRIKENDVIICSRSIN